MSAGSRSSSKHNGFAAVYQPKTVRVVKPRNLFQGLSK